MAVAPTAAATSACPQVERVPAGRGSVGMDADVVGAGVECPHDAEVGIAGAVVVLHDAGAAHGEERADRVEVAAGLHRHGSPRRHDEAEVVGVVPRIDGSRRRARQRDPGGGRARVAVVAAASTASTAADDQRAGERPRVQHGVGVGVLRCVEVDVVGARGWRLIGECPANVAEVLAGTQRAVAVAGDAVSSNAVAGGEDVAVHRQPHRHVERTRDPCWVVVGDAIDLHRDAVACTVDLVGNAAFYVRRTAAPAATAAASTTTTADDQRAGERPRVQHRVRFGILRRVEMDVVGACWWRLVVERPADVAEVVAGTQRAVAVAGDAVSSDAVAAAVDAAVHRHPYRHVERTRGPVAGVVGDAIDLHRDAVAFAVDLVSNAALYVRGTGECVAARPGQQQNRQQPKEETSHPFCSVHVNAPPPLRPVSPRTR